MEFVAFVGLARRISAGSVSTLFSRAIACAFSGEGQASFDVRNTLPRSIDETCGRRPALPETIAENIFPARKRALLADASLSKCCPLRCFAFAAPVPVRVPAAPHERFVIAREWSFANFKRNHAMSSIGQVTKQANGSYKGQLKTLAFRADISIVPNADKKTSEQPDFRVLCQGVEIGAGWVRRSESSGQDYVSLSLSDPSFGPKKLYANLGRAAGQDDSDVLAIIWNAAN
ncbi:MAG TPA: DUF736 family protein [Rhizomicrobium sp.]